MSITKLHSNSKELGESGFGVVWIFGIIMLAGLVAAGIALSNRGVTSSMSMTNCVTQLTAQANLIRQKVSRCALEYPAGNNGGASHLPYPAGTASAVSGLTCPGNNNANLWTGADGIFLPNAPTGFNSWTYTNDGTSVRISITPSTVTNFATTCMNNAAARFTAAEASVAANTLTIVVTN